MGEIEKVEGEFKNVDSVEDALKLTEDAISKTLPLEVDEFTTLVGAIAGPGKLFTYDYQLRGEEVENISPDELEAAMRPTLEAQYKSDMMRAFREGKVTALYRYSDSKGKPDHRNQNRTVKVNRSIFAALLSTLPLVWIKDSLPKSNVFRSRFNEFIGSDVFDRALERKLNRWSQLNAFVRTGSTVVGHVLCFGWVDWKIVSTCVFTDNHAGVNVFTRAYEKLSAFFNIVQRVGHRRTFLHGNERSRRACPNVT